MENPSSQNESIADINSASPNNNLTPKIDEKTIKTSNIIIWLVALFPLALVPLDSFLAKNDGGSLVLGISMIPIALCLADREMWLKSQKIKIGSLLWPILFYPVYIWKRSNILNQSKIHLWAWLGSMILFLVFSFYPMLTGGMSTLEQSACQLTTQIIKEQFNGNATCKSVAIIESEGKEHYAIAELSSKETINISITEVSGGRIYVEFLQE